MTIIEKFVPLDIKSGNRLGGSHWTKYNYRNQVFKYMPLFFHDHDKPKSVEKVRAKVSMIRVMKKGQKKLDIDNLAWGTKPIFDFLQKNKWLYNDSPKWIDREYNQVRAIDCGMKENNLGIVVKIEYEKEV